MQYYLNRSKMILHFPANAIVAEIGVYRGEFSEVINSLRNPKEFYLIDLWEKQSGDFSKDPTNDHPLEEFYEDVCNMFKSSNNVKIIRNWSHLAADMFPDEYFDWIYLDADHAYDSVKADLNKWYPKVKHGGIFAGHDYVDCYWVNVKSALKHFLAENNLELSHLTLGYFEGNTSRMYNVDTPSWAFTKP